MFSRTKHHDPDTHTETVKGPSLARGPAWFVGLALAGFGLAMFWKAPGTPLTTDGFTGGDPTGASFLGFEVNAWTAWFTVAAGVLVLIGAAQHLLAKALSLVTGLALAAAAILALVEGDVLGLAAANGWTALGWGVAGAILLIAALLPRVKRQREIADAHARSHTHGSTDTTHRDHDRDGSGLRDHDRDHAAPVVVGSHDGHADHDHGRDGHVDHDGQTATHDATSGGSRVGFRSTEDGVPGGVQSQPLQRTYDGPAESPREQELREQAEAVERTRTR